MSYKKVYLENELILAVWKKVFLILVITSVLQKGIGFCTMFINKFFCSMKFHVYGDDLEVKLCNVGLGSSCTGSVLVKVRELIQGV